MIGISGFSYTTNQYGEIVVSGTYNSQPVSQALSVPDGGIILFDPTTLNFRVVDAQSTQDEMLVEI